MTIEETQELTGSSTTPPPTIAATPPAAQPPAGLDPAVYAPDGKMWKDKFYGASGALKQLQAQSQESAGGFEQQILTLTQALKQRDATISSLNEQMAALGTQVEGIPGLQEQIQALTQQAMRADRYQMLMGFPQLVGLQVEQQVPGAEGEEPQTVVVNPVLQLVESSQMPPDQLKATLQQFAATLPETRSSVTSPAIPAPAAQQENKVDTAWQRIVKAKERLNSGDNSPGAHAEHQAAWQNYYAVQVPELS